MREPLFTTVEQVSFTVSHLESAVKYFSDVCRIGPWHLCNFGYLGDNADFNRDTIKVADTIVGGRYVGEYAVRIAQCVLGNVEIELIQPMDKKSIFSEYLENNGPGGQHLAIDRTEDFGAVLGIMAENGYPLAQLAKIDDIEDCAFVDHMRTLGTYLELHRRPEDFSLPEILLKNIYRAESERTPLFSSVDAISFAVQNADLAAVLLKEKYGIGPWECGLMKPECKGGGMVRRLSCRRLNTTLELFESVEGSNAVEQFLKQRGPGIMGITLATAAGADAVFTALGGKTVIGEPIKLKEGITLRPKDMQAYVPGIQVFKDTSGTRVFFDHLELLGTYLAIHIKNGEE